MVYDKTLSLLYTRESQEVYAVAMRIPCQNTRQNGVRTTLAPTAHCSQLRVYNYLSVTIVT
jgi:hypothetical protein